MPHYIVSTDLDGTLLDHHNYSYSPALPAIRALKECDTPIVINTSKTSAEVIQLQHDIPLVDPFIVENGSAVLIHAQDTRFDTKTCHKQGEYYVQKLGVDRADITQFLISLRGEHQYAFSMFADFTLDDVIKHTGLDEKSARLSKDRAYSEPLIWEGTALQYDKFCQHVLKQGLRILKGGRFIHVLGQTNKGHAFEWLAAQSKTQHKPNMIALGDSHNDLDMLSIADTAVLCRSPSNPFPPFSHKNLIKTEQYGPQGWNDSILAIIK